VDLSAVVFVDSAGLAALVRGLKDARLAGGDLRLVRPGADEAMRVFRLTRFDRVFELLDRKPGD
jgi:anti-sigma B factor antagonist